MQNIHELIGLIKGIDFDGVINEQEIEELTSWVNKNRNFANTKDQQETIQLLDDILADGRIDPDEKERLYSHIKKYENDKGADIAVYELNGIIRGIICDQVINEAEAEHLRTWMDTNSEILQREDYVHLYETIERILEDNIVTKEEQVELLKELRSLINSSKLDHKIRELRETSKKKENIGIALIDILDNQEAMDVIHMNAIKELHRSLISSTGYFFINKEDVFISLVLIALTRYDSNYYSNVDEVYDTLYQRFSEQKIEGLIRTVISQYRTEKDTPGRTRIINTVLKQAIVPQFYLPPFFEFIFDIYKLNFEYSLDEDLHEEFRSIYEGLKANLSETTDDLQVSATKKTYKLIKSTKMLINDDFQVGALIELSIIVIRLIDKTYWEKEVRVFNPYLKYGYDAWIERVSEEIAREKKERKSSELRSRWETKLRLINNEVYLITPVHRIKAEYDYRDVCIKVFNGSKEIFEENAPDIREIIGGYQLPSRMIKVEEPLGQLTYKIMAGDEVIYDSRDRLYRSLIAFDEEGQEIENNKDYSGNVTFCLNEENKDLNTFLRGSAYNLAERNVTVGDVIVFSSLIFNFSKMLRPGIFGEQYENASIVVDGKEVDIYKAVSYLVIECENDIDSIQIEVNEKVHKLSDFKYEKHDRAGIVKYSIEIALTNSDVYHLAAFQLKSGKVKKRTSFDFVVDAGFSWDLDRIDDTYCCLVQTDLSDRGLESWFTIEEYRTDNLSCEYKNHRLVYLIQIELPAYSLDGAGYINCENALWIGDINTESVIHFLSRRCSQVLIRNSYGRPVDLIDMQDDIVGSKAKIGTLISYKSSNDYVDLEFISENVTLKRIRCYNKCLIDERRLEISFDPYSGAVLGEVFYFGKGNVYFSIEDKGVVVFNSEKLPNGGIFEANDLHSFVPYNLVIYEKGKGLLASASKRELYRRELVFVSWKDLIGREFKFKRVYFDQCIGGEFQRKHHYFNTTYIRFTDYDGNTKLKADIYVKLRDGKKIVFSQINPVEAEICSEVIDGEAEFSIETKDGDGLLLDFKHHTIMNTLYDRNAIDIFSYIVDMSGGLL